MPRFPPVKEILMIALVVILGLACIRIHDAIRFHLFNEMEFRVNEDFGDSFKPVFRGYLPGRGPGTPNW